jgi:hypothetical protein
MHGERESRKGFMAVNAHIPHVSDYFGCASDRVKDIAYCQEMLAPGTMILELQGWQTFVVYNNQFLDN